MSKLSSLCSHVYAPGERSDAKRMLFEEGALTSAPRGSGPTLAEAERCLKSWGSQVDLTEIFEMGISDRFRLNGPDDYGPGQIVPLPLPPSVLQGTAIFSESFSQLPPGNVAALRGSLPLKICLKQLNRQSPIYSVSVSGHRTSSSEHPRGQSRETACCIFATGK